MIKCDCGNNVDVRDAWKCLFCESTLCIHCYHVHTKDIHGNVAERIMAPASKAGGPSGPAGSNPAVSAVKAL